ncbi:MAG: radical SAM protein [Leptospiraceae bacterium]|nr:MAG: radical SAM protein [Leptospiraceae bacterium]
MELINQNYYKNFEIVLEYNENKELKDYNVNFGDDFPEKAKEYLSQYIHQTKKYKNFYSYNQELRFSLYQPAINSVAEKRYLYYRLLRKFLCYRAPAVVTVGVTKKCQCRCVHCSADYHMSSKEKELSLEEKINAINESIELGVTNIILVGGEPLLYPHLIDLIKNTNKEKSIITMFTNGEFLTNTMCYQLKQAGLKGIFVSLDSYKQEEHDNLRKRKIFYKALDGIQNAINHKIPVAISSYLTSERVQKQYIENFMELGKELGIQEITFFDAIPTGRFYTKTNTFLSLEDRKKILSLTYLYRKRKDYPIITPQSIFTSQRECSKGFCFAATTQFYISSQGYVCPCDFTPLTSGKYPDYSIKELWEKLIQFEPYKKRSKECRMQNEVFRRKYIYIIPGNASLPYPIDLLQ